MLIASSNDKPLVAGILTAAFVDNKSVNYLIPQDGLKLFRIHQLMEYSFDMCMLFGKVFVSDDHKGCALVLFPELKKTGFRSVLNDLKLIFGSIGVRNLFRALRRERLIKTKQFRGRMAYLWFIGVDPAYQKFGLGKRLLEDVISYCAGLDRPVYLETSSVENLPFYAKFGFEVYDELDFGYVLYFLKRKIC